MQLARHALRPSSAARVGHHMRQRDERRDLMRRDRGGLRSPPAHFLRGGKRAEACSREIGKPAIVGRRRS